jgi:hypothetical protein
LKYYLKFSLLANISEQVATIEKDGVYEPGKGAKTSKYGAKLSEQGASIPDKAGRFSEDGGGLSE